MKSAKDLANPGVRLAWGSAGSVTEKFCDDTLAKLSALYGPAYAKAVKANVLVHDSVALKEEQEIEAGTVDAAIVLLSSITNTKTLVIDLGDKSVPVIFSGGVVKSSKNAGVARDMMAFIQSPEGQAILKARHENLK